jgi:drug/metabolite transporter (DMT)-like permease
LTIALALTPVVVAVAGPANIGTRETLPGHLWPGLAAVAGLLLMLTEPSLTSPLTDVLLVLAPLLTGCGAVLFCNGQKSEWSVPAALLGAGIALALAAGIQALLRPAELGTLGAASVLDAVTAVLSVLALRRLGATRWSAQFALIPLIVLVEGVALLHNGVFARMMIGLLLLASATVALLMPPSEELRFDLSASRPTPTGSD